MEIKTKLSKEQYDFNKDSETHLLVELTAPKIKVEGRPPICVVPVLDVSGSMAGDKIDYLRKACRKLIDNLSPTDYAGVVAFDTNVYEVCQITRTTQEQKEIIKKKVADLHAGSCTNLSGGLLKALEWVNKMDLPVETVLRVIVFTDGQANAGIVGDKLLTMANECKGRVSVSTFGFGTDVSHDFLADMSSKCDGNYAYIDSADAALSAFGRELGGLMMVYGQNIKVSITPDKNNKIVEVLNDEDVQEKDGSAIIELRDILGEEQKFLVAKVKLSKVDNPLPRKVNAFSVEVSFTDREGKEQKLDSKSVKVKFCKVGEEPKDEDAEVVKHRDRLLAGKAQAQAEIYARKGDYQAALYTMNLCCDSLSDQSIKGAVGNLAANYVSAQSYTSTSGINSTIKKCFDGKRVSHRSKDIDGTYSPLFSADCLSIPNSVADNMAKEFSKDDDQVVDISTGTDIHTTTSVDTHNTIYTNTSSTKKRSGEDW